jgi:hypothetical protein
MPTVLKPVFILLALFISTANLSAQTLLGSDSIHQPFSEILSNNVKNGQVNYAGIKSDPRFKNYILTLQRYDLSNLDTPEKKLAFWINAYNAFAIQGILDGLSPANFFSRVSYFKTTDYVIGGKTLSLYQLEHKMIMPFKDPRIHFAIVCASLSCPELRSEAYFAVRLDEQLNNSAVNFINDQNKNEIDAKQKLLHLSKIFSWYKKDFEQHSGSVQEYIIPYVLDKVDREGLEAARYHISYLDYNWSLNGTLTNSMN